MKPGGPRRSFPEGHDFLGTETRQEVFCSVGIFSWVRLRSRRWHRIVDSWLAQVLSTLEIPDFMCRLLFMSAGMINTALLIIGISIFNISLREEGNL